MEIVTLKRHRFKFYLTIVAATIFSAAFGTILLFTFSSVQQHRPLRTKDKLMPFVSIGLFALAIYTVYKYYKNAPLVVADSITIRIGKETYAWAAIESIELTGKQYFPYLISYAMESVALHMHNGQTKYLFDDMYENAWELKSFLKQVIIDQQEFRIESQQPIDEAELGGQYFETFSGKQLTNSSGIMFWFVMIMLGCIAIFPDKGDHTYKAVGSIGLFAIVLFVLLSRSMYYFKLSDSHLLVQNINFFWWKKMYRLADIREVVFETKNKMPNCLRVITKDYKTKLYPAATLWDKTWLAMKDKLEQHGITVRNECISEYL